MKLSTRSMRRMTSWIPMRMMVLLVLAKTMKATQTRSRKIKMSLRRWHGPNASSSPKSR